MTIVLALLFGLMLAAPALSQPADKPIGHTTIAELAELPKDFRDGIVSGILMAFDSPGGMTCPLMTAGMLREGIWSRVRAGEIPQSTKVYDAALYVLVRAGCRIAPTKSAEVRPNA